MGGIRRNKVAIVHSGALIGFNGSLIEVEADIKAGLPGLQIVGMGNKAIDEARQRVRSAITNSLLDFPAQKITVNLAPAELPKDGTHLDLPIALSILVSSGQLQKSEVKDTLFAGELALDGTLRPIRGAVLLAEITHLAGMKRLILPAQNAAQAQLVTNVEVIGITGLKELYGVLKGLIPTPIAPPEAAAPLPSVGAHASLPTFDDVVGHEQAKRMLVIAAAGRHNVLLSGSPGSGKTLLAQCLAGLLPPLTSQEMTEVTKLHSLSTRNEPVVHASPPFRAPHHSVTLSAFIGGGLRAHPGEVSLAHKGILFLDELPEYPRPILEALRQPLEERIVHLSRLYEHITYPADVLLVATMNPCPCGYAGDSVVSCSCTAAHIASYQKRISGPLLDRIDLRMAIEKVNHEHFFDADLLNSVQLSKVLTDIKKARDWQHKRYGRSDFYNTNASLSQARRLFDVTAEAKKLLDSASTKLALTSRGYLRVLRVARTIADLCASTTVEPAHIAEALQFR